MNAKEYLDAVEWIIGRKTTPADQRKLARIYRSGDFARHIPVDAPPPSGAGWEIYIGDPHYNLWVRVEA